MSGETEIEVSVVSEEDFELENSRDTPPSEMLLHHQEKTGKSFSFDMSKATLRPVCNPQYTSFSISSILGRPESPPSDSASAGRSTPSATGHNNNNNNNNTNNNNSRSQRSHSPNTRIVSPGLVSKRLEGNGNSVSVGCNAGSTSPVSAVSFSANDTNNPLIGHQASADLTMLSRLV